MAEEKQDFLEVDDPVSGQNFCLLSFVEPEDIIQNKEAFKTAKYLQSIAKEKDKDFKDLYEDYLNFQYKYSEEIENDYVKENGLKTNMRGLKVRGVYSTKEEAESKALKLQKKDSSFHVFVGQVGYWLPFNPIADKIEDEKFINDGLQELMEGYKQNSINKDILYEEDKRDKLKRAAEELAKSKEEERKRNEEEAAKSSASGVDNVSPVENNEEILTEVNEYKSPQGLDSSLKESLEDIDPWLKNKVESQNLNVPVDESEPEPEVEADPEVEPDPEVDADPKA